MKYPKIQLLEDVPDLLVNPVHIFEKLDGANVQMYQENERLVLAGRSGEQPRSKSRAIWWDDFASHMHSFYSHVQNTYACPLSAVLPNDLIFFGEWTSLHTIEYEVGVADQFYLIDVYDKTSNRFLPYDVGLDHATASGMIPLRGVPVLYHGTATTTSLDELMSGSVFGVDQKEGLVLKDYENQRFAKYLHPAFSELKKDVPGIRRYLTPRRLEKVALSVVGMDSDVTAQEIVPHFISDVRHESPHEYFSEGTVRAWVEDNLSVAERILKRAKKRQR